MTSESANGHAHEFTTPVEPPLVLDDPESADWSDAADIVVIGFGSAGAVAGLHAREDGASVIAVDRFGGGGFRLTGYSTHHGFVDVDMGDAGKSLKKTPCNLKVNAPASKS